MSLLKPAILFFCFAICLQGFAAPIDTTAQDKPHILGYLFSHGNWSEAIKKVRLQQVTDINIAFLQPDSLGNFAVNDDFTYITGLAHSNHVRIFFSIGGGEPPAYFARLMQAEQRENFIKNIAAFAFQYNFDGVDADIENDLVNKDYEPFITALAAALKPQGKLLTAAIASWSGDKITDSALAQFDYISIMSYDKTGPWQPKKPGQHAPFAMVQSDLEYFTTTRHIPASKLLVGLPFYGYGFGKGAPESMDYKTIVDTYQGAEQRDEVSLPRGGIIYYNGMPTIKQKVSFAKSQKAAGVMIWQILGDSEDKNSLLQLINRTWKQ